ncbi:MAG: hypothetical protein PHG08_04375 [Bacilli bacterium]|nr:hypothetical protein [Bacilli bacterium]
MRKILISICIAYVFLFVLSSCTNVKDENFIGIAKVDIISDIAKEHCYLELDVYSGANGANIDLVPSLKITKVNKERYDVKLINKDKQTEGFLHRFRINFVLTPFSLTKLAFKVNAKVYSWPIGRFSCEEFKSTTDLIPIDVILANQQEEEYELSIQVLNKLERSLFLFDMERISIPKSHSLILTSIPSAKALIYPENIKTYSNLKLKFSEKYYQAEGLIKLTFVTNLRKEYIYASYYVNRTPSIEHLQKQGIEIHDLEEVKV